MRARGPALLGRVALLACLAGRADAATPEGRWRTIDDRTGAQRAIVRIWIEKGRLTGGIEHVFPRPGESPDPVCRRCKGDRQGKKVIGMLVLWGHRPQRGGWEGGRLFDPESGREHPGRIWMEGPDRLRVRGYWGPFHRTQTWHRIPPGG